jgi:hypothetical protein
MNLHRIRWAVRAVLVLGLAASATGNVLHAQPNPISRSISAWPVVALYLAIDLISRIPVNGKLLAAARLVAAAAIAGIAAWVSYWHMAGVAARYGETGASPYLLPLSVDGLIVVASICLVELGGRIRAAVESTEGASDGEGTDSRRVRQAADGSEQAVLQAAGLGLQGPDRPGRPEGEGHGAEQGAPEEVAAEPVKLSRPRKPHTTNPERVARAWQKTPDASPADIARRLKLSPATVKRHRPADTDKVNGREPEFAAERS